MAGWTGRAFCFCGHRMGGGAPLRGGDIPLILQLGDRLLATLSWNVLEFLEDSRQGHSMGISIKNDRAEKLARQVSAETGESLTEAIIHSLEERLERLKGRRSAPDLAETLMAISRRSSALPDLDTRSAEEILGYDEKGAFR